MKWVKTMPKPKKEEALDLETPIEEVVETPAEETKEEPKAKVEPKDKVEEVKAEEPKAKPEVVAEVRHEVTKPILTTELFAVQHTRTDY